ncbi:MAG: hypothetical protein PHR16_15675 [Methylovulum sp.]|nr:hypothetical protein [Methylovulum sp.]
MSSIYTKQLYLNHYPKNYASMPGLLVGLAEYFIFYNVGRFHQTLGYKTPDKIYRTGNGGGVKIADHFGDKNASSSE